MDEFPGLLSRDFGVRPQGKAAPMAASKGSGRSSGTVPMSSVRSNREFDDSSPVDRGKSSRDYGSGGLGDFDGIFPPDSSAKLASSTSHNSSSFDYDSVFDSFKDPVPKKGTSESGPVFDKPLYDDEDMFGGIPGLRTSSSSKFDDVFSYLSSSTNHHTHTADDDLLGDLSGKEQSSSDPGRRQTWDAEQAVPGFDELIPGFGRNSSPQKREYSGSDHQQSSSKPNKSATSVSADPFADLQSASVPAKSSEDVFVDPLNSIGTSSRNTKSNASSKLFDDLNSFSRGNKPTHFFSSDENTAKIAHQMNQTHPTTVKESSEKAPVDSSPKARPKKGLGENHRSPEKTHFDVQGTDSNSDQFEINSRKHTIEDEDIWLTVSEIPLFTQPTSAPPPSRHPPPFSRKGSSFSFTNKGPSAYANNKSKVNSSDTFSHNRQTNMNSESFSDSSRTFGASSIDELEDFAMGKPHIHTDEQTGVLSSEEDNETSSAAATSAAAMKNAMDRDEAKIKQARELREREKESKINKNREYVQQVKNEKSTPDLQNLERDENLENFDPEKEMREREEKEKERRRLEKERERALVEKALREARGRAAAEARERAANEARQRAERAAVEKANAEARDRAARAAVNKATAEARERAAAEAREKAAAEARAAAEIRERAAAEARERANREAREKEAREKETREREAREKVASMTRESQRAAVHRAAADARQRAERAAVERANREARERAAAAATAAAREKQYKDESDLDSFFGMGGRATSEPKHRPPKSDFSFDAQVPNMGGSTGSRPVPSASSSSSIRKTSSANFLDDLTSVFGASSSSGEFQEIDGESEERRRARLERHQRTLERAAKALAEKNQRDMQVQREQVERDRIADKLEFEIKRWSAGKEGNLRALLSTLQYVLWPECGWQAVSLTDLITAAAVKKVYRKATLHLHPDKVQQKGANLEQKIIAEKVFDLLKEAWNKFNSEELF